jgi:hypothetical protein
MRPPTSAATASPTSRTRCYTTTRLCGCRYDGIEAAFDLCETNGHRNGVVSGSDTRTIPPWDERVVALRPAPATLRSVPQRRGGEMIRKRIGAVIESVLVLGVVGIGLVLMGANLALAAMFSSMR